MKIQDIILNFHDLISIWIDNITKSELLTHPKLGASWEAFALESIIQGQGISSADCFYWGVHGQVEIDLITPIGADKVGYEIKYSSSPSATKAMHTAITDLGLDQLYIVYPGEKSFPLAPKIRAISLHDAMNI